MASDKEEKVGPLREAFQNVFGQATVIGLPARSVQIPVFYYLLTWVYLLVDFR